MTAFIEMPLCLEHGLTALDIGQMLPVQLTMRKFDVKKNSFLRKDCAGPVGKPDPLLHEGL
jgi:hypothetical protein